jgi:hypothetical protein
MSDRASVFSNGRGLSRFEALPEEYEVKYHLAEEEVLNGKGSRNNHFPFFGCAGARLARSEKGELQA